MLIVTRGTHTSRAHQLPGETKGKFGGMPALNAPRFRSHGHGRTRKTLVKRYRILSKFIHPYEAESRVLRNNLARSS